VPYAKDLVPIDSERLSCALDYRGKGHRELGRLVARKWYGVGVTAKEEKAQAVRVDKILSRAPRRPLGRCQAELRKAIAQILRYPEDWLSGERSELPGAFYSWDYDQWIPSRTQLAQYDYWQAIAAALTRDFPSAARGDGVSPSCLDVLTGGWLCEPRWWTHVLFESPADSAFVETDDQAEAREHLVRAFKLILRPWLRGESALNHQGLHHLEWTISRSKRQAKNRARASRRGNAPRHVAKS
jgi:hypothetical protein